MITVGLIKELYFISSFISQKIGCSLRVLGGTKDIHITISPNGEMVITYDGQEIWKEDINSDISMFGIESCDTISRIISCIDNKTDWSEHEWKENLDILPKNS